MRRLRLQYDYGNYSTYDYGHITLQDALIHTVHNMITLHYVTVRIRHTLYCYTIHTITLQGAFTYSYSYGMITTQNTIT